MPGAVRSVIGLAASVKRAAASRSPASSDSPARMTATHRAPVRRARLTGVTSSDSARAARAPSRSPSMAASSARAIGTSMTP